MSAAPRDLVNHWKPILRALDPHREVGLGEIEALYAEREAAPYKELAAEFALADQPALLEVILCGARGSGKSGARRAGALPCFATSTSVGARTLDF